jgi:hypothetical protein
MVHYFQIPGATSHAVFLLLIVGVGVVAVTTNTIRNVLYRFTRGRSANYNELADPAGVERGASSVGRRWQV